jgi:hypothetical protein
MNAPHRSEAGNRAVATMERDMSAVLAPVRLRGPGIGWIPAALRQRETWRTVWRFAWAGPLVGAVPYLWMVISVPVAYFIGAVPALLAGLLFGAWYHGQAGRTPTWPWRAAIGALSGAGAAALVGLATLLAGRGFDAVWMAVLAIHGVPAAVVLALLQKPAARPQSFSGGVSSATVAPCAPPPSSPVLL